MKVGKSVVSVAAAVFVGWAGNASEPAASVAFPVSESVRGHENTEWSVGYAYNLVDGKSKLPRVLLVGDSICKAYESGVRSRLKGRVNVSYWASSYCVTSPGYLKLLSFYLDEAKYDVIHFNNGLHSLSTPDADWARGFRAALDLIARQQPDAKVVWCTSTPLRDAAKTAKVKGLNALAAKEVERRGNVAVNDLFSLLDPLDRSQNWSDTYHHKPPVVRKESEQVAESVVKALADGRRAGSGGL